MTSGSGEYGYGGGRGAGGYGYGQGDYATDGGREKGVRRRRLAEMAGNVYRAGAAAVGEIRESYAQTRTRNNEGHGGMTIPGSFPDVAITVQGDDQMVIFPSYAKRHLKRKWDQSFQHHSDAQHGTILDEDYWKAEWERNQDEHAIVDVDVRGWIYSPHKGPMTRKNRILIGLARQLSGIPRPDRTVAAGGEDRLATRHQQYEELREQERIAREAARIERIGQEEKNAASRGDYSERPGRADDSDVEHENVYRARPVSGGQTPISIPSSPTLPPGTNPAPASNDLSEAELAVANANLMARIAPFMTTPLVGLPITIFFYNEEKSQSRTVMTNEAGHFMTRAALDFVPTHIRVLANESLSAIQEVKVIEPAGVSLISDIDDTIKRSNISSGAREIFRNTFVRDLGDLTIEGVTEWYTKMHELGVSVHYCSNSPWQLFPVLASYFMQAKLPPGSLHLKQYSGMLQGIFEPVAERKRSTLDRLMVDFPERKFILVGDSSEADLEVYTELTVANPERILAIFIRDVTTPEQAKFFDKSFDTNAVRKAVALKPETLADGLDDSLLARPALPPRRTVPQPASGKPAGPPVGNLIDLTDEPEEANINQSDALSQVRKATSAQIASATDASSRVPPPRPSKPASLRSSPSNGHIPTLGFGRESKTTQPPPPPPRSRNASDAGIDKPTPHLLSQMRATSEQLLNRQGSSKENAPQIPLKTKPQLGASANASRPQPPPPPPPRRRATPSSIVSRSPRHRAHRRAASANSNSDIEFEALPKPVAAPTPGITRSSTSSPAQGSTNSSADPNVDKKLQMWRMRLERAQDALDRHGVQLYTWRRGQDVIEEAVGIVKKAQKEQLSRGDRT